MAPDSRRDDLLIAVALAEFSYRYEDSNPELAERAWQFAADRLVEHKTDPYQAFEELELEDSK